MRLIVTIIVWFISQLVLHQAGMPFCHESVGLNTSSRHCYVNIIKMLFVIALQACWHCCKWHCQRIYWEQNQIKNLRATFYTGDLCKRGDAFHLYEIGKIIIIIPRGTKSAWHQNKAKCVFLTDGFDDWSKVQQFNNNWH